MNCPLDSINVQLNHSIVQRCTHPRTDRVEGQTLHPSRFALKLGEHCRWFWSAVCIPSAGFVGGICGRPRCLSCCGTSQDGTSLLLVGTRKTPENDQKILGLWVYCIAGNGANRDNLKAGNTSVLLGYRYRIQHMPTDERRKTKDESRKTKDERRKTKKERRGEK